MFVFVRFECTHTQMQVNVWKTNTAKQLHAFGISQNKKKTMCCMTICPCCRKCFDTLRFEANLFFPLFWTKPPISKPNVCLSFFAFSFFVFSNYHNGSFGPLLSKPKKSKAGHKTFTRSRNLAGAVRPEGRGSAAEGFARGRARKQQIRKTPRPRNSCFE